MKIIVVNGCGGSGKTSFEKFFKEIAEKNEKKVLITSMVEEVKEIASWIGWNGGKTDKDRRFLSDLKDTLDRYNDFCYNSISNTIKLAQEEKYDYVLVDVREPNDIKRIVEEFNGTTILLDRGISRYYSNHADDNVSNYNYNFIIDNKNDINNLKESAQTFYEIMEIRDATVN